MKLRRSFYKPGFFILVLILEFLTLHPARAGEPVIQIWYGHHQTFGQLGTPQPWVNILGNVSDPDGITNLNYSLNGQPERVLTVGPDRRRLAAPGDFNIDIPIDELAEGSNQVVITAVDGLSHQTVETVTVEWTKSSRWPQPYSIDWSRVEQIQDVVQVVDGQWRLEEDGIRPAELGYDRLIAIGDLDWDDYEVTVQVTIHGAEPLFEDPSHGAMVGILTRWQGHRVWDDSQPAYGWWPLGVIGQVAWVTPTDYQQALVGNKSFFLAKNPDRKLEFNVPYYFKVRAETVSGQGCFYSFKLWKADEPEPPAWDLKGWQRLWDPVSGSVLLVAHHVDVTFGDVKIMPLNSRAPWEWFLLLNGYLVQTPLLLVCLAGIVLSLRYWRRYAGVTRLTFTIFTALLIETLVYAYLGTELSPFLQRQGWTTHAIGLALAISDTIHSLLLAVALGLLIAAVFRWRSARGVA